MSRHFLSKRDMKLLGERLSHEGIILESGKSIEVEELTGYSIYYVDKKPYLIDNGSLFPSLYYVNTHRPNHGNVTVDDGAVPHIINGANVFLKGIVQADDGIKKDQMVFVRDLISRYICVGISLMDTASLLSRGMGEGIRNIHHLGDIYSNVS
jgi:PUA domain protein